MRRGKGWRTIDVARLPGVGVRRAVAAQLADPAPLHLLSSSWGDLACSGARVVSAGLLNIYGTGSNNVTAAPGPVRMALLDANLVSQSALEDLLADWFYLDSRDQVNGYDASEIFVTDPNYPNSLACRLRAPDPYATPVGEWLDQVRAGTGGGYVRPWPGPGPAGRVVRAYLGAARRLCRPGHRVLHGVVGEPVLNALALESTPERAWTRVGSRSGYDTIGGVVLGGVNVLRDPTSRLGRDEVAAVVAPWAPHNGDKVVTRTVGYVPPRSLLAGARGLGQLATTVALYNRMRVSGLESAQAASAAAAVLAEPGS